MAKFLNKHWKILLTSITAIWLLSSCNSYKGIAKHEPKSTKDTARLATRFNKTFPPSAPEIKQGIEVKQPDSTDYFKQLLSIELAKKPITKDSIITKYLDNCKDVDSIYEEGYYNGYQVGKIDGKTTCPPSTKRVDTFQVDKPQTIADLWLAKNGIRTLQDSLLIANNTIAKNEKNKKNIWWVIGRLFWFWQVWLILLSIAAFYIIRWDIRTKAHII
jgi:hypothetical protein